MDAKLPVGTPSFVAKKHVEALPTEMIFVGLMKTKSVAIGSNQKKILVPGSISSLYWGCSFHLYMATLRFPGLKPLNF